MTSLESKIFALLRQSAPWGGNAEQLEQKAKALASSGAFTLSTDGRIGAFGDDEQLAAARKIDASFTRALAAFTPTTGGSPAERADETLRRMGLGGFQKAWSEDESLDDYSPDPPEAA